MPAAFSVGQPRKAVAASARAPPRVAARRKSSRQRSTACRALEIDWSDPETYFFLLASLAGIGAGIGIPAFFSSRIEKDEQNLEELRRLNRETFKETGKYLTEVCMVYSSADTGCTQALDCVSIT